MAGAWVREVVGVAQEVVGVSQEVVGVAQEVVVKVVVHSIVEAVVERGVHDSQEVLVQDQISLSLIPLKKVLHFSTNLAKLSILS
jgi:formaldehyde-activating enzyme involved in methanogenesis